MSEKTLITDYKLSVLYLLDSVKARLSGGQISDVLLGPLFSNYFLLQQALGELQESGLVRKDGQGSVSYYSLTEQGRESFSYLEKELSDSVRKTILETARARKLDTERVQVCLADYDKSVTGGFSVRLQCLEGKDTVMDCTLAVPSQEAARAVCENWPLRAAQIYETLMDKLL